MVKKTVTITSFTVGHSGSGSFSATGLPPGLSINSATGVISGATSVVGSQNFTITATGTTAGGANVTVSKLYAVEISDPTSFPFRIDLTIASSKVNSTLTDFPLLVSLSTSITGFSYNGFLDGDSDGIRTGGDLRFYASNGKELAYEIADWNTSGTSNIWVKVPTISSSVNTVINAVWGKTGIETTPDYATNDPVWSNGFHGVWHLDGMTNNALSDSSPNGFHATAFNGAAIGSAQVGRGIVLDGTDDYINLGKDAGNPGGVVGVSFWVKSSGTRERILSNKSSDSGTSGWEIFGTSSDTRLWFRGSGSSYRYKSGSVTSWSASNWHHVNAGFHANGSLSLQVDGVNKSMSSPVESIISSTQDLLLGGAHHESEKWNGAFDEVRISNVVRSADWAKAEYDNQKSSGTKLVSYGSITGPRIITSPLTATGTFNSSFSYTLTATDSSNISSRVFYGLPQGLDFNDNGQITGTPTVAGNYQVALVVNYNNDDGSATDSDSLNDKLGNSDPMDLNAILLNLSIASLPPTIDTLAATSVSATRANFEGNVTSAGGLPPEVKIYYGNADGGTTPSSWATVKSIGNKPPGEFAVLIGDLQPSTTYHYRVRAFNDGAPGGVWASTSKSFSTVATNKPVAANGALTNATGTTASLGGKLASLGTGGIYPDTQKPNEIAGSNLKLWLDAADSSTLFANTTLSTPATSSVAGWKDKSGNNNHAVQSTSANQPVLTSSRLQFDGSNDGFSLTNDISEANLNIFFVLQGHGFLYANNGTERTLFYDAGSGRKLWARINDSEFFSERTVSGYSDSTIQIHEFSLNSGTFTVRVNGVEALRETSVSGNMKLDRICLTWDSSTIVPTWTGDMMEIVALSSTENRQKIEGYLAQKWGLAASLPASHPYQLKNGADLTLYWGSTDGGEDENSWDNAVSLGQKSSPLAVWFDASDLDADGTIDTNSSGDITLWKDKSGNNRHASGGGNAPFLNSTGGPSGKQVIEQRSGEYLNVSGTFFAKDHFYVWRSPPANTTWSSYGGALGHNPASGHTQRDSNYITQDGQTYFHSSQLPAGVSKNGLPLGGNFDLAPITNYHVVRITMNDNDVGPYSSYQIGRLTGLQCNLDIAEIIAFESELPDDEADKIESYLAHKWGLADQLTAGHPYKDRVAIRSPRDLGVSTALTGLVKGNTYYYRVKAENSEGTDWADSTTSFVSESKIDMSSGDLTFYTDPPVAWTASDGTSGNGVLETLSWTDSQSNTVQHKVAKFSFSKINIGDGVKVSMIGSNPIHLDVENNATILAKLDASGTAQSTKSVLGGGLGGPMHDQVGWRNSRLFGDADSGISSDFTYTAAINLHGSTRSVNGVSFTGTTASSGTGWSLSGFTSHIDGSHGSADSTATGDIGAILDDGFKYGGTEKLTISGLTDGKAYVLALYSQAWVGPRVSTITCSDLSETLTLDQDLYHGQTPDSQLTECVYIADGTGVEFTFSANNWHLYAFSNREASDGMSGSGPSHIIGANPYNSGGSRYKGGNLSGSGLVAGEAPGGGSYGGKGGRSELNGGTDSLGAHPISGQTYGNINVDALLAGSGGGAGSSAFGSTGGGAIKITAGGKLIIGKDIYANGGMGNSDSTNDAAKSGAGGSGGAVYLKASYLVINSGVSIRADGGPGAPLATGGNTGATDSGGAGSAAGGGGRVYLEGTNSFLNQGSLSNENISANKGGHAKGLSFPQGISGLKMWLDAADSSTIFADSNFNTLATTSVGGWKDKSGNNNHATQSTSANRPVLNNSVLNSLPVIRFDGSNDVMTLAGDHALQTFFFVLNARDGNNFGGWDWAMGGWTSSGNKKHVIFARAGNNSIKGENASINGGTPSSEYINFSPLSEHKLVRVAFNAPASRSDWKIGDGDDHWNGDFAEIIAYSGTLSTIQSQKIENYLAHKWGLSTSTRLGEDGTVRVVRPQVSSLEFTTVP